VFVRLWMTRDPITARPDDSVAGAYELLKANRIRRAPVVDNRKLVGIFTLTDLQKLLGPALTLPPGNLGDSATVRDIMTPCPLTVAPSDPIESAALVMHTNRISSLPVVDGDRLVGILTETDIFKALLRIMGLHEEGGVRITFELDQESSSLRDILQICARHEVHVLSMSVLHGHSAGKNLLALRIKGLEVQEAIENLRESGFRLLEISPVDAVPPGARPASRS
jgi:acetoin utilization protein AcuB